MENLTTAADFAGANGATLLINRIAGDEEFSDRFEGALANSDLNLLSDILPEVGVQGSVFSLTTNKDDGVAKATTINIKCRKCTITIESSD